MASASLNSGFQNLQDLEARQSFFQDAIERMANYWNDCKAVKTVKVSFLDSERETILKAITLAMDVTPVWPIVKNLMITFTPYMERRGHWDVWHNILSKAIDKAQLLDDVDGTTTLTALLARLCLKQNRQKESVQLSRKVIQLAKQLGNKFEEARACSNLGYHFIDKGHWWRSEILCRHALKIFDQLESKHGLAHTHNHLGVLYLKKQKLDLAEEHFQLAGGFGTELGDENFLSIIYGNLGLLYIEDPSRFHEAEYYLTTAIDKAKAFGEEFIIAGHKMNLAIAHTNSKFFSSALKYLTEAETIYVKYSNEFKLARTWLNMGELYLKQHNFKLGEEYIQKAIEIFSKFENRISTAIAIATLLDFTIENDLDSKLYIASLDEIVNQYRLHSYPEIIKIYEKIAKANLKS